jgi:hypothetical protein
VVFTNETGGVSGNLPDLLSHLEGVYRQDTNQPSGLKTDADRFLIWAKKYLTAHRPSEIFWVNDNYGVLLTNGLRIKLCPESATEARPTGDMANPDTSISITRPR